MPKYKFEIYYQFDGPSASRPFAKEKTDDEINDAFLNFRSEIPTFIDSNINSVTLADCQDDKYKKIFSIETTASEEEVLYAIEKCLKSLDLRANSLPN